jgi:sulfate transport system substrate-binding protein
MPRAASRFLLLSFSTLLMVVGQGCNQADSTTGGSSGSGQASPSGPVELLNASYDPTRELWNDLNAAFLAGREKSGGPTLTITQSHFGSAKQANSIVEGLQADVATLSLWPDTELLHKKGLLKDGWEQTLPNNSVAYTSTVVFLVRTGNPKGIKDWADLVKPDLAIITPNPKTSGNGRLSLLGAWGSIVLNGGTEEQAREFVKQIYQRVTNLDTGARGATATFAIKGIGDVLITMESEAYLSVKETPGKFEIITPTQSILHEPPLAIVDKVVDAKGTREIAKAYLEFLYTPEGQEIIAKNYFRPNDAAVMAKHRDQFPEIKLFPVTAVAKDWDEAQTKFFADGGIFDEIYKPAK